MESKSINRINSLLNNYRDNPKKIGHKKAYQVIYEDFYDIARQRDMLLDELMIAVYLRGKCCKYGNPFKLANKTIYHELNTTREILDKIKAKLRLKGIIKYISGIGKTWTEYTMLDSVRVKKESVPRDTL